LVCLLHIKEAEDLPPRQGSSPWGGWLTDWLLNCCWPSPAQLFLVSSPKVKVTLRPTISPGIEPHLGSWPDINYCLTFTVLSMSGAPSDERSGLPFVLVTWTASVQFSKFAAGPRQHSISPYL
jgi:hypothetical protein